MTNPKQQKSNNALSLGRMIENTKENIEQAEISMEFASAEEHDNLEEKNARRRHAIDKMEEQMREETAFRARKKSFE